MNQTRKITTIFLIIMLMGVLAASPGQTQVVSAAPIPGNHIVYNIYATDSYIQLADGTLLYMYGFIGGEEHQPVVYQNSWIAPPKAPKGYVPGMLVPGTVQPVLTGITPNACLDPVTGQPKPWPSPGSNPACEAQLAGNAQFPAPVIRAAVGDTVEIRLKNLGVTTKTAPNDPHSIHLHGLDVNAANDGVPETSLGAIPANLAIPGAGNTVVYYFTPTHAGTYMYHCHQEADIHVQMGMFGALVVYEQADPAYQSWLATGTPTGGGWLMGAPYTKEHILLLSEFDVRQHISEQQGLGGVAAFNPVDYHPQYWSINGLSFPQTIHVAPPVLPAGFAGNWFNQIWLPAHPGYDPLIVGSVSASDQVLIRVINMGFETQPMHMHGFHGKILGSDQRAWLWGYDSTPGFGLEKNTLTIGSGETYEWLLDYSVWQLAGATSNYQPGVQSRYYDGIVGGACAQAIQAALLPLPAVNGPVPNTVTACPAIPDPAFVPLETYIGGPMVGPILPSPDAGTVPGVLLTLGGVTPFYGQLFPFHNHDDYKATNNGVYPGGMFTMIATVP